MKQKTIKKYLGEVLTILGVGVFTFNTFLLIFGKYEKGSDFSLNFGDISLSPTPLTYNYSHNALWFATIGALLIIVGILIIRNKLLISK
jgi:multisubunit Na+/H+ antiporter MnhG subunit